VILKGVKRDTLYFLQGNTLTNSVVVASSEIDQEDMTNLWHMRLGHIVISENIRTKNELKLFFLFYKKCTWFFCFVTRLTKKQEKRNKNRKQKRQLALNKKSS